MKKSKIILFISLVLCLTLISGNAFEVISAENIESNLETAIMSDALVLALGAIRDNGNIDVVMWQKDIDHDAVEKQVESAISINRSGINEKTDMETVQNYITKKRYFSMKKYEALNNEFITKVVSKIANSKIVFVSRFSPVVIASMPKSSVYSVSKSSDVKYMDVFVNSKEVPCSNVANINSGVSYLKNTSTIDATGKGVKIGQTEPSVLDRELSDGGTWYFNRDNLHPIGDISTDEEYDHKHPNRVAAIMVGQAVTIDGITYEGVAPDAELYYGATTCVSDNLVVIEAMIAEGVNIINKSGGYAVYTYDFFSQWIDHLAFVHDVHFVVAAGNHTGTTENTYEYFIGSPALSYNAITVGNVYDSDTIIENHAPTYLANQYLDNTKFGIRHTSCYELDESYPGYKPDIMAWGTNIKYGNMPASSGTSFSAPLVAGIIAQLCEITPSLLTNNSKIKALLTATAVYRAYDTYDNEYMTSALTMKQGAGIANAKCAYTTLTSGRTRDVTMSGGAHYYTFTINVPSSFDYLRLSMSWIKKNSITGSHLSNSSTVNDNQLADLKLEIFYGTDTSGTPIAWSNTPGNNLELLQFDVENSGTYTVRITNHSYNLGLGAQYISLAWY